MIWHSLMQFVADIVASFVSLFPAWTSPDVSAEMANNLLGVGVATGSTQNTIEINNLLAAGNWMNFYVPIGEAIRLLGLLMAVWLGMLTARVTMWILTKLHVLGGTSS